MPTPTLLQRLAYEGTGPVKVTDLERELRRLWQEAEEESARGGVSVTRACLLTLGVYCTDEASAEEAAEAIAQLTREHPCRAIIIHARPEAEEPRLAGRLSAVCHVAGTTSGGKAVRQVCCEQIHLDVEGSAIEGLAGAVEPLLVADLPAFLWWRAPHAVAAIPRRLWSTFDCLIVDSCQWADFAADFGMVLRHVSHVPPRPGEPKLLDLAWLRLQPWREAIAELFDALPAREFLPGVQRVRIEYGCRAAALMLAGWLASRLGWSAASAPAFEFAAQPEAPEVASCLLQAGPEEHRATFTVARQRDAAALSVTSTLPGRPTRTHQLPWQDLELPQALCGALEQLHGDRVLEEALRAAGWIMAREK
jgi:glucose-6-phosphate dehydrogenase assembly protein OpcA